eukprot:TRINITY_DN55465_c0_g1_i1.p1 TRINITY_DN55465_c0_g1~~TRINITY_DN55465_c0_g1_i1.p1  ORF type:complete len:410 (-),score=105.77 TRINITY_DN55465_c0_g1_i1:90-1319(-)
MIFFHEARLRKEVVGKHVVVTGSTDGIGKRLAERLAEAGAEVTIVGRDPEKVKAVKQGIQEKGGLANGVVAHCDVLEECEKATRDILKDIGDVDIFISNVGRSIRRSVQYEAFDRYHDFQRLMSLNYFGALKMILGVLSRMRMQKSGHIVHVSSFAVPMRQTRFAGYMASKSALDSALQAIAGEHDHLGIRTSSVYMPLVATKMIQSKGNDYSWMPIFTTDQACQMIERAIITKEQSVMDLKSKVVDYVFFFCPRLVIWVMAYLYRIERERDPDAPATPATLQKKKPAGKPPGGVLVALGGFLNVVNAAEPYLMWLIFGPLLPIFGVIIGALNIIITLILFIRDMAQLACSKNARPLNNREPRKKLQRKRSDLQPEADDDRELPGMQVVGEEGAETTDDSPEAEKKKGR